MRLIKSISYQLTCSRVAETALVLDRQYYTMGKDDPECLEWVRRMEQGQSSEEQTLVDEAFEAWTDDVLYND